MKFCKVKANPAAELTTQCLPAYGQATAINGRKTYQLFSGSHSVSHCMHGSVITTLVINNKQLLTLLTHAVWGACGLD